MFPCTSLTYTVSLSLCYAVFACPLPVPTYLPKVLRQSTRPGKGTNFKSFHRRRQLAPPPSHRLNGTVRIISFLAYSLTSEKTTVSHVFSLVQVTYHIRLLCLLTSSPFLSVFFYLESSCTIQPRQPKLTLSLSAFFIVRRLLSTSHGGGLMDASVILFLVSIVQKSMRTTQHYYRLPTQVTPK